jgi:hypothetical protein
VGGLSTVEQSVTVMVPFTHEFDVFIMIYDIWCETEKGFKSHSSSPP